MKPQLIPQPSTTIIPAKSPPQRRLKWLVADEAGALITTPAGRYGRGYVPANEERALQKRLQAALPDYHIVSRPDPHSDGTLARFEAHQTRAIEAAALTPAGEAKRPAEARQMEIGEL
ncbi:MAG: hypothetical protein KY445_07710 [Armatimonadetes bacterium]|nr:hypothetical protein [Armatimonadota bacterium]